MRASEFVSISYLSEAGYYPTQDIEIIKNGDRRTLISMMREYNVAPNGGGIRGLVIDGDLYFWPASQGTHNDVRGGRVGVSIFLNRNSVMVDSDYVRHAAAPNWRLQVRNCPALSKIYGQGFEIMTRNDSDAL